MKRCSKCKETKDFTEFYKCKRNKDGLQYKCKTCVKQYKKHHYKNNKEYHAKYFKERIFNAIPCVYRIKSKVSDVYYIGSTTQVLGDRVSMHFAKETGLGSPFTGKDKNNWEWHALFTGTKEEIRELEKQLLKTRVNIDNNCMNRRIG